MPKDKKIVFVIVEGPSDAAALEIFLDKIYENSNVYVHIMHCDITSKNGSDYQTILKVVCNEFNKYKASSHLKTSDFKEIVHIVDTDGAFIPDDAIVYDKECIDPFYTNSEIKTCAVGDIKLRNKRKCGCLNRLSMVNKISSVDYQVYYMSCNLDHVLHNLLNLTDFEKEENSYNFALKYKNDIDGFIKFISESNFSVCDDYIESWNFIKQEKNSLKRYTNLGICIKRALLK